jgi:hypothetical protein
VRSRGTRSRVGQDDRAGVDAGSRQQPETIGEPSHLDLGAALIESERVREA